MKVERTDVAGAYLVHGDRFSDERGFLAPLWSLQSFASEGLGTPMSRVSLVHSPTRGTLRGMHWQDPPYADAKLVRCVSGAVYAAVVDLRRHSSTVGRWVGARLAADSDTMVYSPKGCAHGFVTLADDASVLLFASGAHAPTYARGARWDDPFFDIAWPVEPTVISERDRSWPDLRR